MSPDPVISEPVADEAAPADEQRAQRSPGRKMFTRRSARIAMPADAAARQGRVAMMAWEALGDGEAVRAFLNTHDPELGGRPIDVATGSPQGLEAVGAAIAARNGRTL